MSIRRLIERTIIWVGLGLFAFFFLYPFWNVFWGALKTTSQFSSTYVFQPVSNVTLQPFIKAWGALNNSLLISLQVATVTTIVAVVFGVLGGYVFRRANFRGANVLFGMVLFGLYIPGVTKLIPAIKSLQVLNLYDTTFGVGLIIGSVQLPIATVLYKQFFEQIPESYFEVASISGANHPQILRKVVLPLSKIPTITVAVLSFAVGWNSLLFPLVLTTGNAASRPASIVVANLRIAAQRDGVYNEMLAAGLLTALPIVIIYLIFQRYVTGGFRQLGQGSK